MSTNRREFLVQTGLISTAVAAGPVFSADGPERYRAAIIGKTGGGDYGHGYDQVFKDIESVQVVAVADHDAEGLKKAAVRCGAGRQYADYREMLVREKPDLVCIAPRLPDCHKEMCLEAIKICRGIFIEKPLVEVLSDGDEILAAADRKGVKLFVAHNRRYSPEFVRVKALLRQGLIGQVRQVHIYGKQDARVGGEDMLVLGVHDFDLMRFYFGDPLWCQSSVSVGGRDITATDVLQGREPLLVAGDTIHASFLFPGNVMVHWSSVKTSDSWTTAPMRRERWAFEILGSKGVVGYQSGLDFRWLDSPILVQAEDGAMWKRLSEPTQLSWPPHERNPVRSLIHAIETNTPPVCSGADGLWAVEMVAAVYESQRTRARVEFPLRDRSHPLRRFTS
jgi:predicted dehydrogenase